MLQSGINQEWRIAMNRPSLSTEETIVVRADVNAWIGETFPDDRKFISHLNPVYIGDDHYSVELLVKNDGANLRLGCLHIRSDKIELVEGDQKEIQQKVLEFKTLISSSPESLDSLVNENFEFHYENGISAVGKIEDGSIDLLLTDPPYSISKSYICESQVPRRLRKNGSDFIMPKGHFGSWDDNFPPPGEWTQAVLPKVGGWAVIFCAHAQIGEYCDILQSHKFSAVGPMVWHKTNPVPFNHKFKPINAWEAIVIGKRSGTLFNGHAVHNVFTHKSPSPQQRIHPTQKPEGLLSEFVRLFSQEGDLVVDPFAGSASTLLASSNERRKAIGYENDPIMFAKAVQRLNAKNGALL